MSPELELLKEIEKNYSVFWNFKGCITGEADDEFWVLPSGAEIDAKTYRSLLRSLKSQGLIKSFQNRDDRWLYGFEQKTVTRYRLSDLGRKLLSELKS